MTTSATPPARTTDDPPTWDLTDLFDGPDDTALLDVVEGTLGHAKAYATPRRLTPRLGRGKTK